MRKIAIVGMADLKSPIPADYEQWVLARYISHFPGATRAFECHEELGDNQVLQTFVDDPWVPLYVPEHLKAIYPKAYIIYAEHMGRIHFPTFSSTISYMLAQAIYEGTVDEIALFGIDMSVEDVYHTQRASCYYWLGVANGRGIKTTGLLTEEWYGLKDK